MQKYRISMPTMENCKKLLTISNYYLFFATEDDLAIALENIDVYAYFYEQH
jgi:hypothetical protein